MSDNPLGYAAAEVREGLADLAEFNRDYDRLRAAGAATVPPDRTPLKRARPSDRPEPNRD